MDSTEGHLTALTKHQQQLSPYLSPEGQANVRNQHDALTARWRALRDTLRRNTELLSHVLLLRQDFHERWTNFEKWIARIQKRLDAFHEVFSDEVSDSGQKLEVS